ncbi:hypothetical protein FZEAL_2052 [Fusarium zealandicum]|uniref:C2H2-type domain-containing protein n=1 Tax=Fusarium zealandicum TaxID=1053134 RepID=A0A8H4US11_9HYPO|nr:hypothetical protein FZEAL_2052 [Fusarium zealandicum]
MPNSLSDESEYEGMGRWSDDTAQSSDEAMKSVGHPDSPKRTHSAGELIEFVSQQAQRAENRFINPLDTSSVEIPSASSSNVPSLNHSDETLSSSNRSRNADVDASEAETDDGPKTYIPTVVLRPKQGFATTMPAYHQETNLGDDECSEPSSKPSPSSSRSASPTNMIKTPVSSPATTPGSAQTDEDDDRAPYYTSSSTSESSGSPMRLYDESEAESDTGPCGSTPSPSPSRESTRDYTTDINHSSAHPSLNGIAGDQKRPRREMDDDEDGLRESTKAKRCKKDDDARLRLACPFYKFDPIRYRGCHAKVLKRNGYVKQHIFRSHMQPIHCERCLETLRDENALRDHRRRAEGCEIREYVAPDGITADQERELRGRGKQKTESEHWFEIYGVIFPGAQKPKSAYLDGNISEDVESLREFMERSGTDIVIDELKRHKETGTAGIESSQELKECVQNAMTTVFDGWHNQWRNTHKENDGKTKTAKPTSKNLTSVKEQTRQRTDTMSTTTTGTMTEMTDEPVDGWQQEIDHT